MGWSRILTARAGRIGAKARRVSGGCLLRQSVDNGRVFDTAISMSMDALPGVCAGSGTRPLQLCDRQYGYECAANKAIEHSLGSVIAAHYHRIAFGALCQRSVAVS